MNVFSVSAFFFAYLIKKRTMLLFSPSKWQPIHIAATGYFLAVMLSMIFAHSITDLTPFRLLFSGLILFWVIPEIDPGKAPKEMLIHAFGAVAVMIGALSCLQIFFPDVINSIADSFLRGRYAYGITIEFNRGRLLHWGALILIFPFFYSSASLLKWRSRFWTTAYVFGGYLLIVGSMIMANFRGEFLVFCLVSVAYIWYARRSRLISDRKILYLIEFFVLMAVFGLIVSKIVLGYNLLERFLLSNSYRDVTETLGRITLYDQALTVFLAAPLLGVGYGNYFSVVWPFPILQYFTYFDQILPMPVPIASHNEFYTALAETGIFGFIGFFFLFFFIGRRIVRALLAFRFSTTPDTLFSLTCAASFLSLFLYVWFENIYPQNIVYILVMGGMMTHWVHLKNET